MTTEKQGHAKRIGTIIANYATDDADSARVIDLLADIRHWCDEHGESFPSLDRDAYQLYVAEFADEENSLNERSNGQLPTPYDEYEIHGVIEVDRACEQVDDNQAQFWSLFGHIPGQGVQCIGDFGTRKHAEEVFARITRRPYGKQGSEVQ